MHAESLRHLTLNVCRIFMISHSLCSNCGVEDDHKFGLRKDKILYTVCQPESFLMF